MKKLILATLAGFVASMISGMIAYILFYQDLMTEMIATYPESMNSESDQNFLVGMGAGLAQAILMTYSFDKMNFNTLKSGALNGIWFSGGIWLVANMNNLFLFKFYDVSLMMSDTLISASFGLLAGGAIGWTLDKLK